MKILVFVLLNVNKTEMNVVELWENLSKSVVLLVVASIFSLVSCTTFLFEAKSSQEI
jgi:hypothetical protein